MKPIDPTAMPPSRTQPQAFLCVGMAVGRRGTRPIYMVLYRNPPLTLHCVKSFYPIHLPDYHFKVHYIVYLGCRYLIDIAKNVEAAQLSGAAPTSQVAGLCLWEVGLNNLLHTVPYLSESSEISRKIP